MNAPAYEQAEGLLRDADLAASRVKTQCRGRSQVFDTVGHTRVVERLQFENDLRRALEHQEFQLHYQPIASLSNGKVSGFEALVRWHHPDRGLSPLWWKKQV